MDSDAPSPRIFLLSPATLRGVRGRRILEGSSGAPFMEALAAGGAVPLGDVYAFISSLYFRGKRAYAERFARREKGPATWVVTPTRGILPVDEPVDLETLGAFAAGDIDPGEERYVAALRESCLRLDRETGGRGAVVLLGSVASPKYLEPLAGVFGRRLVFPEAFVGRGDMSRGGLLLRAAEAGRELDYVVAVDAERRGSRPPRLGRRRGG